jgi:predicted phage terminase large subunit-like protein
VEDLRTVKGPYAWSGQYQPSPSPRGGGIFRRAWWQVWEPPDGKFPTLEYVIASLDSAFTEKEQNSPSGFTVWGIFRDDAGKRRIILLHAWRKFLQFSGPRVERERGETAQAYRRRTMDDWGLIEWTADTCRRFKVDKLLIEAKANGISAAQELRSRYANEDWAVELRPVSTDKVARALAVQATFAQLMVYAPIRDWSEMVIDEMATFPKSKYKDLTDSATQAINYLRSVGLANTDDEETRYEAETVRHKPKQKPLYPV